MFNKLFNKLMSNEEKTNDGIDPTIEENTREASDPITSSPAESAPDTVENQAEPAAQSPGVEVPAGPKVPGTDMSTGITSMPDDESGEDQIPDQSN